MYRVPSQSVQTFLGSREVFPESWTTASDVLSVRPCKIDYTVTPCAKSADVDPGLLHVCQRYLTMGNNR
jgi:hypothetical protein